MKKICIIAIIISTFYLSSCSNEKNQKFLYFATAAEYPPFEYIENGELKGFDIDLAKLIAKELGKEAVFDNLQFSTVLAALNSGKDDIAISTITITKERKKQFDFSDPYYFEGMAAVFKKTKPITKDSQLVGNKVAVQLGTVMEIWLNQNFPKVQLTLFNNNNLSIKALIAGHVDLVLMDGAQGAIYSKKDPELGYSIIAKAEDGYGLVTKKDSPLILDINKALTKLKSNGELKKLESKWLRRYHE